MSRIKMSDGKCGAETVYKIIGSKWKGDIIKLCNEKGAVSFSEIKASVNAESQATLLARHIRELCKDDMLVKKSRDGSRKVALYSLTEKSRAMMPNIDLMESFAKKWPDDLCESISPIEATKGILGNKWCARIIYVLLLLGKARFNELENTIEGITHKMLSQKLRFLQEEDIVRRYDYNENPPHTEYSLTDKGHDAAVVIAGLAGWFIQYETNTVSTMVLQV